MRVPVGIRRFSRKRTEHRRLPFPASPNLRVAQITATTSFDDVEAFPPERWRELETYRPRILVGPVSDLQRLVERVELGRVDVRSVDHVVFVLTECGDKPISDPSRVVLWQTFGVPVIELLAGADGILLACECLAQDGLHPQPYATFSVSGNELVAHAFRQKGLRTGMLGYIETAACPCGRPGTRLMNVEPLGREDIQRELAATA
jgi:hypothetical protein